MTIIRSLAAFLALFAFAPGCTAGSDLPDGDLGSWDGNMSLDGSTGIDAMSRFDAAGYDPFDPDNACGASTIPTTRIPGSLLIVFDRSGSMSDTVGSGGTRWDLATAGMNTVLGGISDELNAGLMLFPGDGNCGVNATPEVPVAPLSTSRAMISSTLAGTGPGGNTPAFAALLAGYDYLDTLTGPGQRGIVLVSDGGESCDFENRDTVFARVQTEHDTKSRLTFAVGLDYADNNLSTIAFNGGTPRNTTCLPMCTSGSCLTDADCGGASCVTPVAGVAGFCSCRDSGDCVAPQTCESPAITIPCFGLPPEFCAAINADRCEGDADCCHYNAAAADFQAQFEAALDEIARRLLDSCVFDLPRGADPSMFDPTQVNVGVTFSGEDRQVLGRSTDDSVDSWDFTSDAHESIIIQGPICDRLLTGSADVQIVLGCPTILI